MTDNQTVITIVIAVVVFNIILSIILRYFNNKLVKNAIMHGFPMGVLCGGMAYLYAPGTCTCMLHLQMLHVLRNYIRRVKSLVTTSGS